VSASSPKGVCELLNILICRRPYGRALLVNTGSPALPRRRARWARRLPHAGSHTCTRCTPPSDDALANRDHSTGSLRSKPAPRAGGAAPPTTPSATAARPDPVIGQARSHSRESRGPVPQRGRLSYQAARRLLPVMVSARAARRRRAGSVSRVSLLSLTLHGHARP
jgi:hypothetical protein